jgi:hypothetical protein
MAVAFILDPRISPQLLASDAAMRANFEEATKDLLERLWRAVGESVPARQDSRQHTDWPSALAWNRVTGSGQSHNGGAAYVLVIQHHRMELRQIPIPSGPIIVRQPGV